VIVEVEAVYNDSFNLGELGVCCVTFQLDDCE
jgi:hypothetical protein